MIETTNDNIYLEGKALFVPRLSSYQPKIDEGKKCVMAKKLSKGAMRTIRRSWARSSESMSLYLFARVVCLNYDVSEKTIRNVVQKKGAYR